MAKKVPSSETFALDSQLFDSIVKRALYLATQMIYMANHRSDKHKGDPKVGGHPAASSSCLHILGALHLVVKTGFDHIANKPHASPSDHAYNYLLNLLLHNDLTRFSLEEANQAMAHLRHFSPDGSPVFQSYHSVYDPDHHNFFPSGTVGIPPVQAGYLALAYRMAREKGYEVPDAHFWSIIGDSEFREGSLFEAVPDFAERELGSLTWILDYNRQSLDGHRLTNRDIMGGTDAIRVARTMEANGWQVINLRDGKRRERLFQRPHGDCFKQWLDQEISDYELQVLLQIKSGNELRKELEKNHQQLKSFLKSIDDKELWEGLRDLGGHDLSLLVKAMEKSKKETRRPSIIIAHTLKGWGLNMAATPGNHSSLPDQEELNLLKKQTGLTDNNLFIPFSADTSEGKFLKKRGDQLYAEIKLQHQIKEKNRHHFNQILIQQGEPQSGLDINLKLASYPHTQWMLGQLTAKLTRIANTPLDDKSLSAKQKALTPQEKSFKLASEMLITMAPDVGTSTNLNPAMDGHIYGTPTESDYETVVGVKDHKTPDLIPGEALDDRYLRFEIAEANVVSCVSSFGKLRDLLGIPFLPLMTVYDFFIKRALDQYFYGQYWNSSFILCGTPSGVTLSPEGAQHGWKSDFQIPNQITWEPFFCQELDWILCDAIKRHLTDQNEGRSGVVIRGVTRGVEQKDLFKYLKRQKRFKEPSALNDQLLSVTGLFEGQGALSESNVVSLPESKIEEIIRSEVLAGAYTLISYEGYLGYEPGENVVQLFAMGSLGTEALHASEELLKRGIYANVIMVTSPDLLVGHLGHKNHYQHLINYLGINSHLYLVPQNSHQDTKLTQNQLSSWITLSGRRIPIVSVHDGEPGLLDNLGSIVGVKQESLAVRKHSRCGRPADIYAYHHIDAHAIIDACGKILAETALENMRVSPQLLTSLNEFNPSVKSWQTLWPSTDYESH